MTRPLSPVHSERRGFTLLELLTVMAIIIVLAGLILAGVGFAQQKAARERATAEIMALSVALESYKVDNGEYFRDKDGITDNANPVSASAPAAEPSRLLFLALHTGKYFEFKSDMVTLSGTLTTINMAGDNVTALVDPFGNPYGYGTGYHKTPPGNYRNPTFDLWSTGGTPTDQAKWITNW